MPNFTFTGPQGQQITVTGPDGSTPEQAFAIMQQHMGGNPAQTKVPGYQASDTGQFTPIQNAGKPVEAPTGSALGGIGQAAVNTVSGGLNAIPRGLMGLAGAIKGAVTPGQTADNQAQSFMDATPQIPQLGSSDDGIYTQAARNALQGAVGKLANIPSAIAEGGSNALIRGLSQPNSPAYQAQLAKYNAGLQGTTNIAANVLPMFLGARTAPEAAEAKALTPKQQILQMAQQKYGLKIAPGEAGGSPIASGLEDITGAAMAEKLATAKNQPVINKIGAQDINQPNMPDFSRDNLISAKQAPLQNYNAVGKIGIVPTDDTFKSNFASLNLNPNSKGTIPNDVDPRVSKMQEMYGNLKSFDAQDALNKIGELRSSGWSNIKAPNEPERNQLGGAQLRAADAFENQLDRYVQSRPEGFSDPQMIKKWQDARTTLAKIHTIEAAKTGTDLSVGKLVKAYSNGAPLTGGLLDIAKIGEQFPNSLKDASKIRGPRTFTKLGATVGAGGGLTALALGHPAIAGVIGAGMVGTPMLRSALLSKPIQASLLPRAPLDPALLRILMGGVPSALNAQGNSQ